MATWKDTFFSTALKVMKNPTAQKILANENLQNAVGGAVNAGFTVKDKIEQQKKNLAKQFGLSTEDDLREIKREVDRLQRQVDRLKKRDEEPNH